MDQANHFQWGHGGPRLQAICATGLGAQDRGR
ncbi:hypothetical protein EYZ11_010854 [Aspergillus tanneri]|uniref:Uncharacterized protein n=1 Tax=Aspergillus tanneri TaxID=1220188 RepID=A0A4S3J4A0_9EURO|nr:hypothetical protein EYZ11_010854 [Aspergillus tanneri]